MLKSMLQGLREARAHELEVEGAGEAGFTLIELMVVLLIIAILLAIAIPTFLGVTKGANDRAAQSNLTNALTEAAAIYQNNSQTYPTPAGAGDVYNTSAPEFTWVTGSTASVDQNHMSVSNFDVSSTDTQDQGIAIAELSKTGTCWYAVNLQQPPGTGSGMTSPPPNAGTYYFDNTTSTAATNCTAGHLLAATLTYTTAGHTGSNYSNPVVVS